MHATVPPVRTGSSLIAATPAITRLPAELFRLIVSHLLPPEDSRFRLGSKKDLQNANLAHSCFRPWVPEFIFHDMALVVVTTSPSQLERLLAEPFGAKVAKYIRRVQVQVPPAIRWEMNCENPNNLFENTMIKLSSQHFGIDDHRYLPYGYKSFCEQYHVSMVEPFTNSARWLYMLDHAYNACAHVFKRLPKLEHVESGICLPKHHPSRTITNAFVKAWGVEAADIELDYIKDYDPNLAWISGVILSSIPSYVTSLKLWAANLNDLNCASDVNRLLSKSYSSYKLANNPNSHAMAVTSLTLCIGGHPGTHGTETWDGNTGSTGVVKYWADVINAFPNLSHLALVGKRNEDLPEGTSDLTDPSDYGWLTWLSRRLKYTHLRSLAVHNLTLDVEPFPDCVTRLPPSLETVLLDNICVYVSPGPEPDDDLKWAADSWIDQIASLREQLPSANITINDLNIAGYAGTREVRAALEMLGVDITDDTYTSGRCGW